MAAAVVFWIIASIIIGSALAVVLSRSLFYSVLFLIISFVSTGSLFISLNAEFVGLVYILIYAGAVSTLLIIGVMLTRNHDKKDSNPPSKQGWSALALVILLLMLLSKAVLSTVWVVSPQALADKTFTEMVPEIVLVDLLVPFQLAGFLLLIAMVGAIVLAKGVDKTRDHS